MRYDICPYARYDIIDDKYHCIQPCCWYGKCEAPPRKHVEKAPVIIVEKPKVVVPVDPKTGATKEDGAIFAKHQRIIEEANKLVASGITSPTDIAKAVGVHRHTLGEISKRYPGMMKYEPAERPQIDWPSIEIEVKRMLAEGDKNWRQMAEAVGLRQNTLYNHFFYKGQKERGAK